MLYHLSATSNGGCFLPYRFWVFIKCCAFPFSLCVSISVEWSTLDPYFILIQHYSNASGTSLKPFLFVSPLCELQSARLCWIVTCLRAKSWQAAWLSKGPALAAKRAHITRPPVARSYGNSKWQTKVNTLTWFIYLRVRLRGSLCMRAKNISPCPICVSECQCG